MGLPKPGVRVSIRYRRPAGSVPPLSDVVGHLLETGPPLRVRTKAGEVVDVAPEDVLVCRELPVAPVRTSEIRRLEHAAALAWPGTAQHWIDGWLLRAGPGVGSGHTRRANSAVPLLPTAGLDALPAIVDWYAARGLRAWLACAERILPLPPGVATEAEVVVLVRDIPVAEQADRVRLAPVPDDDWLRLYRRPVPVDVLTAVVDGEVAFATLAGCAVGRGAVTTAPDGTRWVGLSAVQVDAAHRRRGYAREIGAAVLAWGAERGAQRAYVQVLADNTAARSLCESMGFGLHHRGRYVEAAAPRV